MMRRLTAIHSILLGIVFAFASCGGQANEDWKIDLSMRNVGTNVIAAASVKWGEFRTIGGIVSPSCEKVHVGFDHPVPDTATVSYMLPDGKEVSKTVTVKSAVPAAAWKDRDMTVMFDVNGDTGEVTVNFLHFIEKDGYAQLIPYDKK